MLILTPDQIQEVLAIIDKYTLSFIARTIGVDILSQEDKDKLAFLGIDWEALQDDDSYLTQAFKFGMLSDAMGDPRAKVMSYSQFTDFLRSGKFVPLSDLQRDMLTSLKLNTVQTTAKISAGIKEDVVRDIVQIQAGKSVKHDAQVMSAAEQIIEERKGVNELKSLLGHQQGNWNRQWDRMADYVLHQAFNEGRVASISKTNRLIFFDVFGGACNHCSTAYLTEGLLSAPIIWTAETLKGNGSNVGRKAKQWKATIGPMHPWCRCTVNACPIDLTQFDLIPFGTTGGWMLKPDSGWIWDGFNFIRDASVPIARKVERRSKIAVTVNGVTTTI